MEKSRLATLRLILSKRAINKLLLAIPGGKLYILSDHTRENLCIHGLINCLNPCGFIYAYVYAYDQIYYITISPVNEIPIYHRRISKASDE